MTLNTNEIRLAIHLEGGLVYAIYANTSTPIRFVIQNFDIEGADQDEMAELADGTEFVGSIQSTYENFAIVADAFMAFDEEIPAFDSKQKDGVTLMNHPQSSHSLVLVNLSSGDSGLALDGKLVLTADPNFEPVESVAEAAKNLATILNVHLDTIEIDPPKNDDWNWNDVLILINNPDLKQFRVA